MGIIRMASQKINPPSRRHHSEQPQPQAAKVHCLFASGFMASISVKTDPTEA
jgi:hypothetical protein